MKILRTSLWMTAAVLLCLGATARPADAGTIILEGSDAIGFHSNGNVFATAYRDQVWSAIGGADPRSIAVIGGPVSAGVIGSGTHAISRFATVPLAIAGGATTSLSDYVALYFLAGGGCCSQDNTLPAGNEAAISAYLTAGGTVMIEDYDGGAAWDFAVDPLGVGGTYPTGTANGSVAGVGGGLGGFSCNDGETVTALGLANGFTQPGPLSCWTHQAYDQAFFAPLGFTLSFFDSPLGVGVDGFSSLLSSGTTVTGRAPEPTTLAILGLGLAGLGFARRRKAA